MPETKLEELEKQLKIKFKNKDILREAFTHRSYLNENTKWALPHNERLEYLGDAVLELVTTDFLFNKFPEKQEGELTSIRAALVNHTMLSNVAESLSLEKYILLSRGEAKDEGRAKEAIIANSVEALIGAIYIDQNYAKAEKFIKKYILDQLEEVLEKELFIDAKSQLQEIVQEGQKLTPTYKILQEEGPDHDKEFIAAVFFGNKKIETGKGFSKQEAERDAAVNALKKVEKKKA